MRLPAALSLLVFLHAAPALADCRCHSRTPLDLVLILDATDSMGERMRYVQGEVAALINVLQNNSSELRAGQVSYGESLQADGFTTDAKLILKRIADLTVFGNFEPIDLALDRALAMDWSPTGRKVIILIGDEPPDNHDNVNAAEKSYELATAARERGIIVHTVSSLDPKTPLPEFAQIAQRGGGEAIVLPNITELGSAVARLCLGRDIVWGEELALPPQEFTPPVRGPLLLQKLDAGEAWNLDRDDLTRLLIAARPTLGRQYSWTTIHPAAEVEDYEKAPVLFISSHGKLGLSDETRSRLYDYVARGGFILADDCCNDPDFDRSFRASMAKLFPEHAMTRLSPANAIYNGDLKIAPEDQVLLGIQYECRTAVIYCPHDLSCRWAQGPKRGKITVSEEAAFALGRNILEHIARYNRLVAHAPKPLLGTGSFSASENVPVPFRPPRQAGRVPLAVAQIIFEGDWDPPTQTLERVLTDFAPSGVQAQRHAIRLTDENLYDYPLLFLTGHGEIALSDPELARLKEYLEKGGFLFANACCGDPIFDGSFRLLVTRLGLNSPLARIPADQNVYNIPNKIRQVALTPTGNRPSGAKIELVLEGVMVKGRWAIVYSPRDTVAGLLENPCSLCDGYLDLDSPRILTNILMYGLAK